jgi:hypothetical protein
MRQGLTEPLRRQLVVPGGEMALAVGVWFGDAALSAEAVCERARRRRPRACRSEQADHDHE